MTTNLNELFQPFNLEPKGTLNSGERKKSLREKILEKKSSLSLPGYKESDKEEPLNRKGQKELIAVHSLLLAPENSHLPPLDDNALKILYHFQADALISNTPFEKETPPDQVADLFCSLLAQVKATAIPTTLHQLLQAHIERNRALQACQDDYERGLLLTKALLDLPLEQSLLMATGRKKRGIYHPLLLQFTRVSTTQVDLCVYEPGKEKKYPRGEKKNSFLHKNQTLHYYKNIPLEELLGDLNVNRCFPDFFSALIRPSSGPEAFLPTYESRNILNHLHAYHIAPDAPEWPKAADGSPLTAEISQGRSHNDSVRGLEALLRRFVSRKDYKTILLEMRLKALVHLYETAKDLLNLNQPKADLLHKMLKESASGLLRDLANCHEQKILVPRALSSAVRATALDVRQRLKDAQALRQKLRKEELRVSTFSLPSEETKKQRQQKMKTSLTALTNELQPPPLQPQAIATRSLRESEPPMTPNRFVEWICQFAEGCKRHTDLEKDLRAAEIRNLVEHLPIPIASPPNLQKTLWDQIPLDQLSKVIFALSSLIMNYEKDTRHSEHKVSSQQILTSFSLYAILLHLTLRLNTSSSYGQYLTPQMFWTPQIDAMIHHGLIFTSPQDFERLQQIECFFTGLQTAGEVPQNSRSRLFNFEDPKDMLEALEEFIQKSPELRQFCPHKVENGCDYLKDRDLAASLFNDLAPTDFSPPPSLRWQDLDLPQMKWLGFASVAVQLFTKQNVFRKTRGGVEACKWYASVDAERKKVTPKQGKSYKVLGAARNHFSKYLVETSFPHGLHFSSKEFLTTHYPLSPNALKLIEDPFVSPQQRDSSSQEGGVLVQDHLGRKHAIPMSSDFLRAGLEFSLTPHKIISYFLSRMALLENAEWQTLFDMFFWRLAGRRTNRYLVDEFLLPVQQELKQSALEELVLELITAGVERYFLNRPRKRPNVMAVLFFIRLSARLRGFLNGKELVDSLALIKQMLKTPDLSAQETSALNLHLIIAYSHSGKKQLEKEELEELFSAWSYYKNVPLDLEWQNFLLDSEATHFIQMQSRYFSADSLPYARSLLERTFLQLTSSALPKDAQITSQGMNIRATYQNSYWEMNLLSGHLLTESGVLKYTIPPPDLYKSKFYQELFGTKQFQFFQSSSLFYFSDPLLGNFRVWKNDRKYDKKYSLQRQIGGSWYQYISPKEEGENAKRLHEAFPRALIAGHTHWLHTDPSASSYQDATLVIYSHPENVLVAQVNQEGELSSSDKKRLFWSLPVEVKDFVRIERQEYILLTEQTDLSTRNLRGLSPYTLSFPRLVSGDQPLSFEISPSGQCIYAQNPRYIIEKQTGGLLGGTANEYILLTPIETPGEEKRPRKLLVPGKPIERYHPLYSTQELDIEDNVMEIYIKTHQDFLKCEGRFHFYEYDLKEDGSLLPLSQDGLAFLAYIYLGQGRYAESLNLLKKIDFKDQISYETEQHLLKITQLVEIDQTKKSPHDATPEAAAVALFTWVLLHKLEKRAAIEGKVRPCRASYRRALRIYYRNQTRLPRLLRLSEEDEKELPAPSPDRKKEAISNKDPFPSYGGALSSRLALPHPHAGLTGESSEAKANRAYASQYCDFLLNSSLSAEQYKKKELYTSHQDWKAAFVYAYQEARNGTPAQKKRLALRLQLVGTPYIKNTDDNPFKIYSEWVYLAFALNHPDKAPPLPTHMRDLGERWNFLKTLQAAILSLPSNSTDQFQKEFQEQPGSLPTPPLMPPPLLPKQLHAKSSLTQKFDYYHQRIDEGFPGQLIETYFEPNNEGVHKKTTVLLPKEPPKGFVQEEETDPSKENPFAPVLVTEYKNFVEDYTAGISINDQRANYKLKDFEKVKEEVAKELESLEEDLTDFKKLILEFAKHQPSEDVTKTLLTEAEVLPELSLERLIGVFLKGDKQALLRANPALGGHLNQVIAASYNIQETPDLAIDYLCHSLTVYMMMRVHANRLKRAKKWIEKIDRLRTYNPNAIKEQAFVQALADELNVPEEPIYSVEKEPYLLFFEYLSGFSVRKEQAEKLRHLLEQEETAPGEYDYKNLVEQFIMGGGKTAFIAVVCMFLAAKKERLAIFVTVAAQYPSVRANLSRTLKDYFDQEVEEIDARRANLTDELCADIEQRLLRAMQRGDFLLITPQTLLGLCLSFLDLIAQACSEDTPDPEALMPRINMLRRILRLIKEHGDALLDEVDLLLNVLEEVNYPLGEPSHVPENEASLYVLILKTLINPAACLNEKGETVDLKNPIGLLEDRQTLITKKQLFALTARAIAWRLSQHAPLKFTEESLRGKVYQKMLLVFGSEVEHCLTQWRELKERNQDPETDPAYKNSVHALSPEERLNLRLLQSGYLLSASPQRQEVLQESYMRYISGEMNPEVQKLVQLYRKKKEMQFTHQDQALYLQLGEKLPDQDLHDGYFLIYLFDLNSELETQEAADLIALTKHLFQDVLSPILERICKFHFGKQNFQEGFTQQEFDKIAAKWIEAASEEMGKVFSETGKELTIEMTSTFMEFKSLSGGILLTELSEPRKTEFACAYINSHADAKKRFSKHICPLPARVPGKVVPYVAVDTPSENEFGYAPESCFYLLIALSQGFTSGELRWIVEKMLERALQEAKLLRCDFDLTPTARRFRGLSEGFSLQELDLPEKFEEALANINANHEVLLELATELALEHVTFYEERLSATGMNLIDLVKTARGMSGTPWNAPCYHRKLHFNFDLGTEGQIAHMLIERMSQNKGYSHVHKVKALDQAEILQDIPATLSKEERFEKWCELRYQKLCNLLKELFLNHPKKDRVKLLIDSGAFFKEFSNEEVARALADILNIPVLFFTRNKAKQEKAPNTLAVVKPGRSGIELICGTRAEDIEKVGLKPGEYFAFMDQAHTTGTDIPLEPDCVGLMTLNETLLKRSFFQAALRLRRLLLEQEIEFVIPEHIIGKLVPFDHEDEQVSLVVRVLLNSLKNQAIALANHYFRSRKQQIDAVFREILLRELERNELTLPTLKTIFEPFRKLTVVKQSGRAYLLHGALKPDIDSMDALEIYAAQKLALYAGDETLKDEMRKKIDVILEEARNSLYRPIRVPENNGSEMGLQLETQTEQQVQQETQQELEIEQELVDELGSYRSLAPGNIRAEEPWSDDKIEQLLEFFQTQQAPPTSLTALSLLLSKDQRGFSYKRDYSAVFQAPIYATSSWIQATTKRLPIFHKVQFPLEQILVIKVGAGDAEQLFAISLAEREAEQFKQYLTKKQKKNIWLIQANGSSFCDLRHGREPLPECDTMQHILLECNVFNGTISYLLDHPLMTLSWLQSKKVPLDAEEEKLRQLKMMFLKLRVIDKPTEKSLLLKNSLFGALTSKIDTSHPEMLEIREWGSEKIHALREKQDARFSFLTAEQLNRFLLPDQVALLPKDRLCHLRKKQLVQKITEEDAQWLEPYQMPFLAKEQVPWIKRRECIQRIPIKHFASMKDEQIAHLHPWQVQALTEKTQLTRLLPYPELMAYITSAQVEAGWITEQHVSHLKDPAAILMVPLALTAQLTAEQEIICLTQENVARLNPDDPKDQAILAKLHWHQVNWLTSEKQLLHISDERMADLSSETIHALVRSSEVMQRLLSYQVDDVAEEAISQLPFSKTGYLTKLSLIRALPETHYCFLHYEQLQEVYRKLSVREIAIRHGRKALDMYKKLSPNVQKQVAESYQPYLLSSIDIDNEEEKQILYATNPRDFGFLETEEQLRVLLFAPDPAVRENALNADLCESFISKKVRSKDIIQALIRKLHIYYLAEDPKVLQYVTATQIPHLRFQNLGLIPDTTLYQHVTEAQIQDAVFEINYSKTINNRNIDDLPKYLRLFYHLSLIPEKRLLLPREILSKVDNLSEKQKRALAALVVVTQDETPPGLVVVTQDETPPGMNQANPHAVNPPPSVRTPNATLFREPETHQPIDTNEVPHVLKKGISSFTSEDLVKLVGSILAGLAALGVIGVGGLALLGAYAAFAPQFAISLYQFYSPLVVSCLFTATGTVLLVGLIGYVVSILRTESQWQTQIITPGSPIPEPESEALWGRLALLTAGPLLALALCALGIIGILGTQTTLPFPQWLSEAIPRVSGAYLTLVIGAVALSCIVLYTLHERRQREARVNY